MTVRPFILRWQVWIAGLSILGIAVHLFLRWAPVPSWSAQSPLWIVLALGGVPLVINLALKIARLEFGSDLLAGMSIVTALVLEEYLAGALVVLMLSGGEALESFAVAQASSVLQALARRLPAKAHRRRGDQLEDVPIADIVPGEQLVVLPHEPCPVDGVVIEGHGMMDESFLTGEPYHMAKTPGAEVLSGAINGSAALTIEARRRAVDSRYAKIMQVLKETEVNRPRLRRLGDTLGAGYTPLALAIALAAWYASGEAQRFLSVLVVATPCPLLIAIPVAVLGSISLAARRGVLIRNPAALEQLDQCRTMIFDKTGTLTYGEPRLTEVLVQPGWTRSQALQHAASLEQYSKHPLAAALRRAADVEGLPLLQVDQIREEPGQGLRGQVRGHEVHIVSRKQWLNQHPNDADRFPPLPGGLECVVGIDGTLVAVMKFRDEPRQEGRPFIGHLGHRHAIDRVLIVSGDREEEVRLLADRVGVTEVRGGQSPEQKVAIVKTETARAKTVFLGDGINDAPALVAATVGVAFGSTHEVTAEAADAVILDTSLAKFDELLHIARRMRTIALQSAVGGMALSVGGMILAALGYLPPVAGAIFQEVIDLLAVGNALRAAWRPHSLSDYQAP
ncbi:MAG TPA: heavy metal translocating P-type ATPase [Gemmatales bacterium]|nr:heavy metal translocating P-type ATPase [Gemmatales bacterium]HMP59674.1 heavy metal translocating P-type ATPase [Gemmatales bacterium]